MLRLGKAGYKLSATKLMLPVLGVYASCTMAVAHYGMFGVLTVSQLQLVDSQTRLIKRPSNLAGKLSQGWPGNGSARSGMKAIAPVVRSCLSNKIQQHPV